MTDMKKDWLDSHIEEQMKNPEFKEAWQEFDLEYKVLDAMIKQIIETRKEQGLTQTDLAKKLETTQAVISRIESGKQNITLSYLEDIAKALGKNVRIVFD